MADSSSPDALCAGPLAKLFNAPILLTGKDSLFGITEQELMRLGPDEVIIVGGKEVI